MLIGEVTEFDEAKGLGSVVGVDGTAYLFHVTEIADGSRHIGVGQPVCFHPLPKFGRYQAGHLLKV